MGINRGTVLELINDVQRAGGFKDYNSYTYLFDQVDTMPEAKEDTEPHWIPCSERLPETTDAVLTTYIVNGDRSRRYVEESSYYGNNGSWSSPWDEYRVAGTSVDVIAWMPMPEPYKGVTT